MKLVRTLVLWAALAPSFAAASPLVQDSCATAVPLTAAPGFVPVAGSGNPGGAVDFWLRAPLQAGESLFVLGLQPFHLGGGTEDVHYEIMDDACGTLLASGPISDAPFRFFAPTPMAVRLGLRDVSGLDSRAGVLLSVRSDYDSCERQVADGLEPNDTSLTAFPIGRGTYSGLNAGSNDPDFFLVQSSPGERLQVEVRTRYYTLPWIAQQAVVALSDAQSGFVLGSASLGVSSGAATITYLEQGTSPRDLLLRIEVPSEFSCLGFDLEVTTLPEPCSRLLEDALEGPDGCGIGTVLGAGIYPGLAVFGYDPDYYELDVPLMAASASAVELTIRAPLQLPDALLSLECNGGSYRMTEQPDGSLRGVLEVPAGTSVRPHLKVAVPAGPVDRCLVYNLEVVHRPLSLGVTVCAQTTSFLPFELRAWGEEDAAANNLWVTLDERELSTVSIILAGDQRDMAPLIDPFGMSVGTICLGGTVRRVVSAYEGEVRPAGVRVNLDVPALAVLQAGTTWIFQGYFTSSLNLRFLTDAVAVTLR